MAAMVEERMQALVMTAPGGSQVLERRKLPLPTLATTTQVRVRLKAAGVNPIDTKVRRNGTFLPDSLPAVLGCDGAGVVEAVGVDVHPFKPGDEVYFCYGGIGTPAGNYAQYTVVEQHVLALKPTTLDFVQAAAVPLVAITAWEALHDRARLQAGQTVLVQAGAGGVGHVAIQIARAAGARVATTISTDAKAELVSRLGAELAIRYRDSSVTAEIMNWTDGLGVDVGMDNIGGKVLEQTFSCVKVYGDVVSLLLPDKNTDWSVARKRNLRTSLEVMLTPMLSGLTSAEQHQADILRQCSALIDSNRLHIEVSQILPLNEAARAHELIESGSTTGKIVLQID